MKQQDTSTTPPPAATEQGAVGSSLLTDDVLDTNQINRLGLHVIEDAVVTEAADEIVPKNDDLEDGIGSSSRRRHDVISPEAEEAVVTGVIKSVNCRGKEIRTSTITWSICALLIVIVAIVVPTTVILSGKNTPKEDDQSPLSTPPVIIDEEEMERQAKLLAIATSLSSPLDLENPSSPQSKALEWLLGPANIRIKFLNVTIDELDVDAKTVVIERYVMATLYYSLGGEEWTKKWGVGNSNFEESVAPVRLWSRDGLIQTDLNGLVKGLLLGDNNLNGTIPPEIQHLQRLQYFHIQENNLVGGNVPMEMEQMSNLTGFWAQDTNIIGEIDFLCNIQERGDNVTTTAAGTTVVTDDGCQSCGFKVDLENVQCSCCTCCL
jgi:hypothetical protein